MNFMTPPGRNMENAHVRRRCVCTQTVHGHAQSTVFNMTPVGACGCSCNSQIANNNTANRNLARG